VVSGVEGLERQPGAQSAEARVPRVDVELSQTEGQQLSSAAHQGGVHGGLIHC
jgi:hypothetical protein